MLNARSHAAYLEGDHAGAIRDAVEALRLFRETGDRVILGLLLGNLGSYELAAGDLDAARHHLAEALDTFRVLNDRPGILYQTFNLGLAEYLGGSPDRAWPLFAESLGLARRMGTKLPTAYALLGLALASQGRADPGWSARLHGATDQALAALGHTLQPLEGRLADLDRQRLRAVIGAEAFEAEYAAGRGLTPEEAFLLALDGPQG
jgi:tetratricopeptide (TPR) repeat protein